MPALVGSLLVLLANPLAVFFLARMHRNFCDLHAETAKRPAYNPTGATPWLDRW
jgi:hypothetical protein